MVSRHGTVYSLERNLLGLDFIVPDTPLLKLNIVYTMGLHFGDLKILEFTLEEGNLIQQKASVSSLSNMTHVT